MTGAEYRGQMTEDKGNLRFTILQPTQDVFRAGRSHPQASLEAATQPPIDWIPACVGMTGKNIE